MATNIANRQLMIQLQVGVSANGQPKLQNHLFPSVDSVATETQMAQVLSALSPLFQSQVYATGYVDTVEIVPATSSTSAIS